MLKKESYFVSKILSIVKLKKELSKHCRLKEVDEYLTSKTCSFCYERVCQYRNRHINKKGKQRLQNIHGVIRCKSNECKLCTMDRDINASRNILYLLKLEYNKKRRLSCFKPSKNDSETVSGSISEKGNQNTSGKPVQGVRFAITPSKEPEKAEARTIKIKIKNRRFKSEKV